MSRASIKVRSVARLVAMVTISSLLCAVGFTEPVASWRDAYRRPAAIPYPDANPFSQPKADLGHALFFDTRFSSSRTHSCASCHEPKRGWSDGLKLAQGEGVTSMALHSPTLLNLAWVDRYGWDGKFPDIESVAFRAILAPSNLNMTEQMLMDRLTAEPSYIAAFAEAFPNGKISRRNIEDALATYERSIVSPRAPFDRWVEGDETALDASAKRGFALFQGKAGCARCHSGWAFTDGSFHDIGFAKTDDIGRGRYFPTSLKLQHAFKTPTLRDIAARGPYMHDGSIATLSDVIEAYDKGGIDRPSRAAFIKPLGLDGGEKADLLAFLTTLSSTGSKPDHD